MLIVATQLREGNLIIFRNELHRVLNIKHLTPGKGQALVIAKVRNIKSGSAFEQRFRSDEKVDTAHVDQQEMEFLYEDGELYHFMNTQTYDQLSLGKDLLADAIPYILPNTKVIMSIYEGRPIGIDLPLTVDLEVVETEPVLKGATASASMKPATLETGLQIQVPQFIQIGEVVRVDTRESKYVERVK